MYFVALSTPQVLGNFALPIHVDSVTLVAFLKLCRFSLFAIAGADSVVYQYKLIVTQAAKRWLRKRITHQNTLQ